MQRHQQTHTNTRKHTKGTQPHMANATDNATATRTVAVIGAMDEEIALIERSLDGVTRTHAAGLDKLEGTLTTRKGETVRVAATVAGMGTVAAGAATQHLIDVHHPEAVLFTGIAGNLNPKLHIDDVVIGGTLRYLDTDMDLIDQAEPHLDEYHSDPELVKLAEETLDDMGIVHLTGTIATGDYFVAGDEKVAAVKAATGADCVEMEGAAVAHISAKNGVPCLVTRAMSDNADTDIEVFRTFDISRFADTAASMVINLIGRL